MTYRPGRLLCGVLFEGTYVDEPKRLTDSRNAERDVNGPTRKVCLLHTLKMQFPNPRRQVLHQQTSSVEQVADSSDLSLVFSLDAMV